MRRKHRNIGRAAAAAVLAVLLTACGKDVIVRGGGGSLLDETRLSAPPQTPAQLLPGFARERARWTPTGDERNGPNAEHTDLLSVGDRASIPAGSVGTAAGLEPSFARETAQYTRSAPYTLVRPDPNAFWQEQALNIGTPAQNSRATYWASSGVSQSSRGGAPGEVGDRVHAEVEFGIGGPRYRVELRHADYPTSPGGAPGSLAHWALDSQSPNQAEGYFTRWSRSGGKEGAVFRSGVPGGGNMVLAVRADKVGSGHTDWLATGMWWYRASSGSDADFGVFADGGAPYGIDRLWTITGQVSYTGEAEGLFSHAETSSGATRTHNLFWTGRAFLIADFGRGGGEGNISGRINYMRAGGPSHPLPGNPTIYLGEAALNGAHGPGVFEGETSMTWAGANYDGDWGGQFFGDRGDDAAGDPIPPTHVAGTFGATASVNGGSSTFIGTFQAFGDRK